MRWLGKLFSITLLVGFLGFLSAIALFFFFGSGLKDYMQLEHYEPPVTTRLYANNGQVFAEYAYEKRLFVPLAVVPDRVKQAFLAAEDKGFYEHGGLDFSSILKAALKNILLIGRGKRPIGASTISQQVAKNFLLNEISTEVSLRRKIKEAILTFRIESAFSKDHILELYLNEIFLGFGSYGVAAAALNYFNKGLEELTVSEAAFLAALPKGPARYHPMRHPERAIERRNWVLKQMFSAGFITKKEAQKFMQEPLVLEKRKAHDVIEAPYFAEEVRRELSTLFGDTVLYKGGLAVRTTLDPELQKYADIALREGLILYDRNHGWRGSIKNIGDELTEKVFSGWKNVLSSYAKTEVPEGWLLALVLSSEENQAKIGLISGEMGTIPLKNVKWAQQYLSTNRKGPEIQKVSEVLKIGDLIYVSRDSENANHYHLQQFPKVSGAFIAMDPHTGRIMAMSGGFSFRFSQFNRATQAKRQVGSTLKSFIVLKALEEGFTPASLIDDSPLAIDLGANQGVWAPRNYTAGKFYGLVTLRKSLEHSLNVCLVRLVYENIKLAGLAEITERFGIYEQMTMHYSNTLGAGESTLVKITSAYATLVNGGYKINPTLIERVQDRRGQSVLTGNLRTCTKCSNQVEWLNQDPPKLEDNRKLITNPIHAYQIVSMLEGAVKRGTSRLAKIDGLIFGGKTGTSNDFHDAWFFGFTPDLVVGVYVGFDGPACLGRHQGGSRVATPVFKKFMTLARDKIASIPFRIPSGVTFAKVDYHTGKRARGKISDIIINEAFLPGTIPAEETLQEPADKVSEISTGTGGLY